MNFRARSRAGNGDPTVPAALDMMLAGTGPTGATSYTFENATFATIAGEPRQ